MTLRIFIADDHAVLVDGLKMILESQPDLEVVGTARDGLDALRDVRVTRPDVVLTEISLPGLNGITATERIRAAYPGVRVIVLTMHGTREHVYGALRAGASGYLLKESAGEEVIEAVRRVGADHRYLGRGVAELIAADAARGEVPPLRHSPFEVLSQREMQVLQLLAEGRSPKEIATALGISPKTVDTYRRRVMVKLDLRSLAALVKLAVRMGLTPP